MALRQTPDHGVVRAYLELTADSIDSAMSAAHNTKDHAMAEIKHRTIDTNGIKMHIAEAGEGPLVLMLHGFPESWYSWRHQLTALGDAGYHAVAPDVRGYGRTDAPKEIEAYSMKKMTADAV